MSESPGMGIRNLIGRAAMGTHPPRLAKNRNDTGFTLLELLVAIVILGLCLTVLTNDISDSLARAQRAETENRAAAKATAMLAELGRVAPMMPGVTTGADETFDWRMVVTPAPGYQTALRLDEQVGCNAKGIAPLRHHGSGLSLYDDTDMLTSCRIIDAMAWLVQMTKLDYGGARMAGIASTAIPGAMPNGIAPYLLRRWPQVLSSLDGLRAFRDFGAGDGAKNSK